MGKSNRSWIGLIIGPEKRGLVDRQMNYLPGNERICAPRNQIALINLKPRFINFANRRKKLAIGMAAPADRERVRGFICEPLASSALKTLRAFGDGALIRHPLIPYSQPIEEANHA